MRLLREQQSGLHRGTILPQSLALLLVQSIFIVFLIAFNIDAQTLQSELEFEAIDHPMITETSIDLYSASGNVIASIPLQNKTIDVITDWSSRYVLFKTLTERGIPDGILKIYDAQTKMFNELPDFYIASAILSPDEQTVAAVTYQPEVMALYLFNITTLEATELISQNIQPYSVSWHDDSEKLVYTIENSSDLSSEKYFVTNIEYFELETGERLQITQSDTAHTPLWYSEQLIVFQDGKKYNSYDIATQEFLPFDESMIVLERLSKNVRTGTRTMPSLKLPYTSGETWKVTQAYFDDPSGCSSHCDGNIYALDLVSDDGNTLGKPVLASAGGMIVISQYSTTAGNYIAIDHGNNYVSRYLHNDSLSMSLGPVSQGDEVAKCGNTGSSSGAHIHFDFKLNGVSVKPEPIDGYTGIQVNDRLTSTNGAGGCGPNLAGNVGGCTLSAGTYNLTDNIYVNSGASLHIMPGVTLNYNGHSFTVNGELIWGP